VIFFWDQLSSVVSYADYVIGNEDEAAAFAKKSGWNSEDLQETAKKLSTLPKEGKNPRTVIFTHGKEPTIVAQNGEVTLYPVLALDKEKIVDTNGAGDSFVGGLLAGLSMGKSLQKSIEAGHYSAREVIQQEGPQYPKECSFDWS
jgi:adenosine kinase